MRRLEDSGFTPHRARAAGVVAAGCLLLAIAAPASLRAAPAPADQRGVVELIVDDADKGPLLIIIRGKEILASVAGLRSDGIDPGSSPITLIAGRPFLSLKALAGMNSYQYDDARLILRLDMQAQALAPNEFNLALDQRPDDLQYAQANSAFLNYAVGATSSRDVNGDLEEGINIGNAAFDNDLAFYGHGATRTGTALTFDDQGTLTRLSLGDSIVSASLLAGNADIMGIDYSRNFDLNPYFIYYPLQTMAGAVTVPSTAFVYVNGQLVRTIQIEPGPFSLQNLPVGAGNNNTRVVITNAYGQQQTLQAPFYLGQDQLRQGVSAYNFALGVERAPEYRGFADYQRPAGLAYYRYGFTDWLTASAFGEFGDSAVTGGAEAAISVPYIGRFGLDAAASGGSSHGWSGAVAYSYQTERASIGADYQVESAHYAAFGLGPADDRTANRYDLSAGTSLFGLGITADYTHLQDRDIGTQSQLNLQFSRPISRFFQASLILSRSTANQAPAQDSALLLLTVPLGAENDASFAAQRAQGAWSTTEQFQHDLPTDEGLGYSLQLQQGPYPVQNGQISYQGPAGLYQVNALRAGGRTTGFANVSGGLVYIDGGAYPTRAVRQSFALVNVPDVPNATVELYNNPVEKTDSRGQALVPNLLPYYANDIGIDPNTVPVDYDIRSTRIDIAPPYRGGAVVTFPLQRIQAVEGRLAVKAHGKTVNAAGDLFAITAAGKIYTSPLGTDGAFYFENLPAGSYAASITYDGGTCPLSVKIPRSHDIVLQLGDITCSIN